MSRRSQFLTLVACVLCFNFPLPSIALPSPPALFNFASAGKCRVATIGPAPSAAVVTRHQQGNTLARNLEWFNVAISSAKASQKHAERLAAELVRLAQTSAFTKVDWSGSGGSPAHWQTNLLKNVAIAVNILDHRQAWGPQQRKVVIQWGDKLWKNSHYKGGGRRPSDRWPDTVATAAAAYTLWGVVAPNRKAYSDGNRDFLKVSRLLKPSGGTQEYFVKMSSYSRDMAAKNWHVRIEDKMLGDLVIAAHAARRNGDDLFAVKKGKVSLYGAIVGWQNTLFGDNGRQVKGMDMSFLATNGQERSWSWTEYFVANFPNDEATKFLRNRSRQIAQRSRYGFVGLATGPSTCLFR